MTILKMQKDMELSYSMKALHKEWRELFEASEGFMEQYNACLDYLTRWVAHEHSSELKNARLAQLDKELLPDMLWAVLLSIISFANLASDSFVKYKVCPTQTTDSFSSGPAGIPFK